MMWMGATHRKPWSRGPYASGIVACTLYTVKPESRGGPHRAGLVHLTILGMERLRYTRPHTHRVYPKSEFKVPCMASTKQRARNPLNAGALRRVGEGIRT